MNHPMIKVSISNSYEIDDTDIKEIIPGMSHLNINHAKAMENQTYVGKVKQKSQTQSDQPDPKFRNDKYKMSKNTDMEQSEKDSNTTIGTTEETEKQNFEDNADNNDSQKLVPKTLEDTKGFGKSAKKSIAKSSTEKVDLSSKEDAKPVIKLKSKRKANKSRSDRTTKSSVSSKSLNTKKRGKSIGSSQKPGKTVKKTESTTRKIDTELEEEKVTKQSIGVTRVKDSSFKSYNLASHKSRCSSGNIKDLDQDTDCNAPPISSISSPTECSHLFEEYRKKKDDHILSSSLIERIKSGDLPRINVVFDLDHTLVHCIVSKSVAYVPDQNLIKDLMETHRAYEIEVDKDKTIEESNKVYKRKEKPSKTNENIKYYMT